MIIKLVSWFEKGVSDVFGQGFLVLGVCGRGGLGAGGAVGLYKRVLLRGGMCIFFPYRKRPGRGRNVGRLIFLLGEER